MYCNKNDGDGLLLWQSKFYMKKLIVNLLLILLTIGVHAQSELYDMMSKKVDKTASFTIIDSAGGSSYISVDELGVQGYQNNSAKLHAPRPEKKYNRILGCQLRGSEYTVFFSNSWHTDLASVSFNFITNTVVQHLIPLKLNKESYFSSFIYQNDLYFITRLKNATGIRFFTFLGGDQFQTNTVMFKNIDTGLTSFYEAFDPHNTAQIDISEFRNGTSNDFNVARSKTKIRVMNEKVYISLDYSNKSTSVIRIDLESYESAVSVYSQQTQICGNASTTFNSFLYKDKLFQVVTCSSGINLGIRNLSDGTIVKQYATKDNEEITFKNSLIIQRQSGSFSVDKELTAKQFMNRILNTRSFVSVSERGETVLVSLGGYRLNNSSGFIPTPTGNIRTAGSSSETLLYFESVLSRDTFDHIDYKKY